METNTSSVIDYTSMTYKMSFFNVLVWIQYRLKFDLFITLKASHVFYQVLKLPICIT
ncbi:MAG: hypothetical protein K0R76_1571 [Alphaproteobacteria bacterium]|jgi:hypothetical protein|nr:hypothetical protein [Alphaproteobacteria bacterium]